MLSETAINLSDVLTPLPILNAVLLSLAGTLMVTATVLIVYEARNQGREMRERAATQPLSASPIKLRED